MECEFGCIASAILWVMRKPSFHLVSAEESVVTSPLYLPLPSRACIPHRPQLSSNPPPRQNCRPPPCALSRHLQPAPRQSASSSVNTTTAPKTTAVQPAAWLAGVCLSPHKCRELPLPPTTTTSACLKPFARLPGGGGFSAALRRCRARRTGWLASYRIRSSSTQRNRRSE